MRVTEMVTNADAGGTHNLKI